MTPLISSSHFSRIVQVDGFKFLDGVDEEVDLTSTAGKEPLPYYLSGHHRQIVNQSSIWTINQSITLWLYFTPITRFKKNMYNLMKTWLQGLSLNMFKIP